MLKAPQISLDDTNFHASMLETLFSDSNKLFSHSFLRNRMMLGYSRDAHVDSSHEIQLESQPRFAHRLCRKLRIILLFQKC